MPCEQINKHVYMQSAPPTEFLRLDESMTPWFDAGWLAGILAGCLVVGWTKASISWIGRLVAASAAEILPQWKRVLDPGRYLIDFEDFERFLRNRKVASISLFSS